MSSLKVQQPPPTVASVIKPEDKQRSRNKMKSSQTTDTSKGDKKRHFSDYANFHHNFKKRRALDGERSTNIAFPTKFKLGGNIQDPLNLRSMNDEEVNRKENMVTPHSSPVPIPKHRNEIIEVIIPPNSKDPLNLMGSSTKSKKKKKKRKSGDLSSLKTDSTVFSITTIESFDYDEEDDQEQRSPQKTCDLKTKEERAPGNNVFRQPQQNMTDDKLKIHRHKKRHTSQRNKSEESRKKDLKSPKLKSKHGRLSTDNTEVKFRTKDQKFQFGNYNRYYGYRLDAVAKDPRLEAFKMEWFKDKDVLDLGCNVGYVTLTIAKEYEPRRIIGMDIDHELIRAARRNVRHYISPSGSNESKFPVSVTLNYGPMATPVIPAEADSGFPHNVQFVKGNYVLENDRALEKQKEEYDMILCLSLTKWVHLNWGDEGLKRMFRRMFRQLRPNGKMILEAQGWQSYRKKKKLTATTLRNFQEIQLKPDKFREYLLAEVGFSKCEVISTPFNKSKGFQRPISLFTKATKSPCYSTGSGSEWRSPVVGENE